MKPKLIVSLLLLLGVACFESAPLFAAQTDQPKNDRRTLLAVDDTSAKSVDGQTSAAATSDAAEKSETPKLTAEKRALIMELLKITEADKNVKVLADDLARTQQKSINTILKQFIEENKELTDKQKEEAKAKLDKDSDASHARFKALFDQKIDLPTVVNEVALKVYNRHFSDSELQDIITFYKSSTGEKAMKLMPQISQESMEEATRIIMPKMQTLLTDYIKEKASSLQPAN